MTNVEEMNVEVLTLQISRMSLSRFSNPSYFRPSLIGREVEDTVNRFLDEFSLPQYELDVYVPADIVEKEDRYLVVVDLPGVPKENIDVKVNLRNFKSSGCV